MACSEAFSAEDQAQHKVRSRPTKQPASSPDSLTMSWKRVSSGGPTIDSHAVICLQAPAACHMCLLCTKHLHKSNLYEDHSVKPAGMYTLKPTSTIQPICWQGHGLLVLVAVTTAFATADATAAACQHMQRQCRLATLDVSDVCMQLAAHLLRQSLPPTTTSTRAHAQTGR